MCKTPAQKPFLGLDVQTGEAHVCVYATGVLENARVTLRTNDKVLFERTVTLSPTQILEERIPTALPAHALTLTLTDAEGRTILSCAPREKNSGAGTCSGTARA